MKISIIIITFGYIAFLYPQDSLQRITKDGISAERSTITNPELDFLSAFEDTLFQGDTEKHIICKIIFDFNFDGLQDIALTDLYFWGVHIGPWGIYLGAGNNDYLFVGEFWFHNDAVRFDSLSDGKSKVIVFERAGGSNVDIVEYLLSKKGINQLKRNTFHFESFEKMNEAFKEYRFQTLKDSCISVKDYLKVKETELR